MAGRSNHWRILWLISFQIFIVNKSALNFYGGHVRHSLVRTVKIAGGDFCIPFLLPSNDRTCVVMEVLSPEICESPLETGSQNEGPVTTLSSRSTRYRRSKSTSYIGWASTLWSNNTRMPKRVLGSRWGLSVWIFRLSRRFRVQYFLLRLNM